MHYTISRILRLDACHVQVLPYGRFILEDEQGEKRESEGWLPCHHGNIQYELEFKKNGDIASIQWMRTGRKKNRTPVTAAAKKIEKGKLAPMEYTKEQYLMQAEHAYKDQATWTISLLYSDKEIMNMNISAVFKCLTNDPEAICTRGSIACKPFLMYNEQRAWETIQRFMKTLSEPPYDDKVGFTDRMKWQMQTKYSTGTLDTPSEHVRGLQFYQNIWTTQYEIDIARCIGRAMAPDNCTLWLGTPCAQALECKKAVVSSLEEAFALKCFVDVEIYMVSVPYDEEYRKEMGLPNIKTLTKGQDVCIPWAHRWGVEQWVQLIHTYPVSFTCVGRLDQYARGRGQIFRQLVHASFPCRTTHHFKTNNVEMIETDDVSTWLQTLDFATIQCFSEKPDIHTNIDTKRRWIKYPMRIRTLVERPNIKLPRVPLCEEHFTHEYKIGKNASVISVRSILTPVDVGVYICSPETQAFDIHVARTLCRHKLYVVNCKRAPFAWEHKAPSRIAVSPFI